MGSLTEYAKPILVVGDDLDEQEFLRECLAKHAGEFSNIVFVSSLDDAMMAVRNIVPVCCVLGNQNGLALLKDLRRAHPAEVLPIIIIAEQHDEDMALESLQRGAQTFLSNTDLSHARLYSALLAAMRSNFMQQQLDHLVHYDSLTGLLNRSLLLNRLNLALKRCDRYQQRCALLHMDIDNFKSVNDSYGHLVADALLQAVAERIKRNCRDTDSTARIGGDEFVVLIERVDNHTGRKIADKLLKSLAAPFEIEGHSILIGASIGLAIYPDTAKSSEELMRQADQALHRAKEQEHLSFFSFSEQHRNQWARQNTLEKELPKAILRGDLSLVYQPIVSADTFELKRLEVLSRWPREDIAVNAMELMEMIDRLNLVESFHEWLFQSAFGQWSTWYAEGISPNLCLNIPANYCYSPSISMGILDALASQGVNPQKVELEITESTLMRFPEKSVKVLQGLHDHGLRIAVDDFGTGYSSMTYLTQLPLDTLKIDRHFFLANTHQDRNRKIIEAITALGHSLDLEIIAEGVETEVQLKLAKEVGCDLLQGFYFGRPAFAGVNWKEYISHFQYFTVPPVSSSR